MTDSYKRGYLEENSDRPGVNEEDVFVLDQGVSGIMLGDDKLDLGKVVERSGVPSIEEVYGVAENNLIRNPEGEDMYYGVGFEFENGATLAVSHPQETVNDESHEHLNPVIEGYIVDPGSHESADDISKMGEAILESAKEVDEENMRERWEEWADQTGYREAGTLERVWIRLTKSMPHNSPNRFGNVSPALITCDLSDSGVKGEEIDQLGNTI